MGGCRQGRKFCKSGGCVQSLPLLLNLLLLSLPQSLAMVPRAPQRGNGPTHSPCHLRTWPPRSGPHHKEVTIIFLESPEPDTQGFWRKQNNTTRGSVNLREIGDLRGVTLSCGYVLRGTEYYICICSGYRNKSVTHHHPSPCSHSHFPPPSPFLFALTFFLAIFGSGNAEPRTI